MSQKDDLGQTVDSRTFPRVDFQAQLKVTDESGQRFNVQLENVSGGGFSLLSSASFDSGTTLRAQFNQPLMTSSHIDLRVLRSQRRSDGRF
ncbi:MAG: PilZ domain-containing protein [Myxococcota bacterium]|nr:PilZ domain-containing protein [Myxococcota bacterium]